MALDGNFKYLWYSIDVGISDDFDTVDECIKDAERERTEHNYEYGIYCYSRDLFPDGYIDIDDCFYVTFIPQL